MSQSAPSLITPAQRALRRLLSAAFDDPARANDVVARALAAARRPALPEDLTEILEFARGHVAPILTAELGAHLAGALVADFAEELNVLPTPPMPFPSPFMQAPATQTAPPISPRAGVRTCSVLIVLPDRLARAPLARALVRGGCNVTAVDDLAAATAALHAEKIDVVILDADASSFAELAQAVAGAPGSAAIVARAERNGDADAQLAASGARDFAVRAKSASTNDLLEAIGRFVGTP